MENNIARLSLYRIISIILILYLLNIINQNAVASLNQISNGSLEITGRKSFEISEIKIKGDTLSFVSGSDYMWYPLGVFKNIEDVMKNQKIKNVEKKEFCYPSDTTNYIKDKLFLLKKNGNTLMMQKEPDDFDGLRILSGKIINHGLILENNIRLRMSSKKFLETLFTKVSNQFGKNIHVVEIISAIYGMWHYYTFEHGKLKQIDFESRSSLRIKK
jgi:hypothetical protein